MPLRAWPIVSVLSPDAAGLAAAAAALADGRPVGVPTDTVYGLAVDPRRPGAPAGLFATKGRPRGVPLAVLVADLDQALELAARPLPALALRLAGHFWPGALTLVVPRRPEVDVDLGHDQPTVGLRCPDHPVPVALCRQVGPLATTSANRHGEATLSTAQEVAESFGEAVPVVLEGGRCEGSPSTVVDCTKTEPVLLREGRIPRAQVLAAL